MLISYAMAPKLTSYPKEIKKEDIGLWEFGKFDSQQCSIQHNATTKKVKINPKTLSD